MFKTNKSHQIVCRQSHVISLALVQNRSNHRADPGLWDTVAYGWPSYSQLIIFTSSKNIFTSSKNIFTGSRNKTLAKATHN